MCYRILNIFNEICPWEKIWCHFSNSTCCFSNPSLSKIIENMEDSICGTTKFSNSHLFYILVKIGIWFVHRLLNQLLNTNRQGVSFLLSKPSRKVSSNVRLYILIAHIWAHEICQSPSFLAPTHSTYLHLMVLWGLCTHATPAPSRHFSFHSINALSFWIYVL
jgi:hypothetical protein